MTATAKNAKATATAKAAPVKDDIKVASPEIVWTLMQDQATYEARVLTMAPVLASRVAGGETQAEIAKGLTAIAKAQGHVLSLAAAKMRVSRYVAMGNDIAKAPKGADMSALVAKSSAKVQGNGKKKGGNPDGNSKKTTDEKAAIVADTLVKIIAKATREDLEKIDGLVTILADAVAARYSDLDTAEKVA